MEKLHFVECLTNSLAQSAGDTEQKVKDCECICSSLFSLQAAHLRRPVASMSEWPQRLEAVCCL